MRPIDGDKLFESLLRDKITSGMQKARFLDLVRAAPTVGGWISVKKRLPESAGQMVLVTAHNSFYNTDEVFPAFLAYGPTVWCTYDTIRMQKVTPTDNRVSDRLTITHWMPMPEPPKETNNG